MVAPEFRMRQRFSWDPFSPEAWAELLGLVHVPLFGVASPATIPGKHAMLLDGTRGSFIMTAGDDPKLRTDATEWTWSANVRHALVIQLAEQSLYISRWDTRKAQGPFKMPRSGEDAEHVFRKLQSDDASRRGSVISWVMQGFRHIRHIIEDPTISLLALNGLLLVAREVAQGNTRRDQVQEAKTFNDAIILLPPELQTAAGLDSLPQTLLNRSLASVGTYFLDQDPFTGHCLRADLLFRHAASDLYQEAHLELERDPQGYFFQLEPLQAPDIRSGPHDVRCTPPNLARALVEQGIRRYGGIPASLTVLDPACGSGIFLQEVARELNANPPSGFRELHLVGFDTSGIAKSVTESCLHLAEIDLPSRFRMDWRIDKADALVTEWPQSDLILMNPPFRTWRDMSDNERENVKRILGDHFFGRPDIAQAFLWQGVKSLKPGGCLATVLPVALLDSQSGRALREAIRLDADLLFVGRFEGFSYFSSSLVETAFVVLQRKTERPSPAIDLLIAAEGLEDAALRSLRGAPTPAAVELFQIPASSLSASSWIPRRQDDFALLQSLDQLKLTSCGDLFTIHQGIRTGNNEAFVLTSDEWSKLPVKERSYFRKAAGQGTIRNGQLTESEFVFYPYDTNGAVLKDEDELHRRLPRYYQRWLEHREVALKKRVGVREWWLPLRPREWQYERSRKLVSTYFGKPGSFAYDEQADYVVLQGFAWFWKKTLITVTDQEKRTFDETLYPFAYLALLNSDVFERILSCYSWRMQGGQFNLEAKFLSVVPLPDLTDDAVVSRAATERLATLGRLIHAGGFNDVRSEINRATANVYPVGMSL
jgi:adenine-specific DNA-methyltransferase